LFVGLWPLVLLVMWPDKGAQAALAVTGPVAVLS